MADTVPAEELKALYGRIGALWSAEKQQLFNGACGYSIFGSRPTVQPRLMVVGENPGFGAEDARGEAHIQDTWPVGSYLEGDTWPLKERLRYLFTRAGSLEVLRGAVFTNFNFFKSGSQGRESQYRWVDIDRAVRRRVEEACFAELRRFVRLTRPASIMVLGMSAFKRHVESPLTERKCTDGKRTLICTGDLWDVPAFALMHPTGARWSDEDKNTAADWLTSRFRTSA